MAQYVYTMNRVSKTVPPKREILKDVSLSFFPGAKIGVLGLNGAGKSTLLRIMAGVDREFEGEARPQADINIGYLPQEPELDSSKDVRGNVEEGVAEARNALAELDKVYAAYAEEDADFDALAKRQAELEDIIQSTGPTTSRPARDCRGRAAPTAVGCRRHQALGSGPPCRLRLLLSKPDMLLLDKPTNHLDAESSAG